MVEQPPRIWWSPSLAAEAPPGSLMAGLMWQHVSGQGYVEPADLPDDAVELVPVPAVGDVAPSLIGPMSRRIGQLGYALRRLADRVEQEWVAPTPPVREALAWAREVLADNAIVADPVSPVDAETVAVEPLRELVRNLEHDAELVDEEQSFDCGVRSGMRRAASQLSDALDALAPSSTAASLLDDGNAVGLYLRYRPDNRAWIQLTDRERDHWRRRAAKIGNLL